MYLLNGFGIRTGVDLDKLLDASAFISAALQREPGSRVAKALLSARAREAAKQAQPPVKLACGAGPAAAKPDGVAAHSPSSTKSRLGR